MALTFDTEGIWAGTSAYSRRYLYELMDLGMGAEEVLDLMQGQPAGYLQSHGRALVKARRAVKRAELLKGMPGGEAA